ncbi:hypothetical protein MRX96_054483 [Rhipicephalus microplus]
MVPLHSDTEKGLGTSAAVFRYTVGACCRVQTLFTAPLSLLRQRGHASGIPSQRARRGIRLASSAPGSRAVYTFSEIPCRSRRQRKWVRCGGGGSRRPDRLPQRGDADDVESIELDSRVASRAQTHARQPRRRMNPQRLRTAIYTVGRRASVPKGATGCLRVTRAASDFQRARFVATRAAQLEQGALRRSFGLPSPAIEPASFLIPPRCREAVTWMQSRACNSSPRRSTSRKRRSLLGSADIELRGEGPHPLWYGESLLFRYCAHP